MWVCEVCGCVEIYLQFVQRTYVGNIMGGCVGVWKMCEYVKV